MSNKENENLNSNFKVEEKALDSLETRDLAKFVSQSGIPLNSEITKEGFVKLLTGYIDYAREVLENRAVPDLRDGLKPVQRYAMWVMYKDKEKGFKKSEIVSGAIMKYHPHNADSAYEAMASMVDSNGSSIIPLIKGDGDLGKMYSNSGPAARRYTSMKLHDNAKELFTAMDGVKLVPNFDNTATSVEVLPVSFPYILTKSAEGIGVGFATNIFSFTPSDVFKLVKERIKDGKCSTVIVPDFATGGYIVPTEKELDKLMQTGKGKFVIRGKVEVDGKTINITEVPHGTTVEKLKKEIDKANIKGIVGEANDLSGKEGCNLSITCSSKAIVDQVLAELYVKTPLQTTANSNLLAIEGKKLIITGVWGIIDRWVEWRRGVLRTQFQKDLDKAKHDIRFVDAFIRLLEIEGAKEEVIELATKVSDNKAIDKIIEYIGCDRDVADWIIRRRLNQFRNGDKYRTQYSNLMTYIKDREYKIENVDTAILEDMDRLELTIGRNTTRKTEITNTVYRNSTDVKESEEEKVYGCYYEIKNGFIKKTNFDPTTDKSGQVIRANSNSMLIAISNEGEIYRIYGDDLEISGSTSIGTFIPTYSGVQNANEVEILWATVVDGRQYTLTYADGFVGHLDTSEFFEGEIKSRYLKKGISEHAGLLVDVREYIPNSAILAETRSGKLALAYLDSIKKKSRTARTRVWHSEEISDSIIIPLKELGVRIPSYKKLLNKRPVDFNGTVNVTDDIRDLMVLEEETVM